MSMNHHSHDIEHVIVPIDDTEYHNILVEIAELIYIAACDAEKNSATRSLNKKTRPLSPLATKLFKQGNQNAS